MAAFNYEGGGGKERQRERKREHKINTIDLGLNQLTVIKIRKPLLF
jgi:hypothetical protein